MALIKCPECGKMISDKADICIGCGFPIKSESDKSKIEVIVEELRSKYTDKEKNKMIKELRERLGLSLKEANDIIEKSFKGEKIEDNFEGIYKFSFWSGQVKVKCTRCGSYNCDFFKDKTSDVVKSSYSFNLNPLKPFTPLNRKDKVVKKGKIVDKYICKDCGKVFE